MRISILAVMLAAFVSNGRAHETGKGHGAGKTDMDTEVRENSSRSANTVLSKSKVGVHTPSDSQFPEPGEWGCFRRDSTMRAQSPLKGAITKPRIAWKHHVGLLESLLVVEAGGSDGAADISGSGLVPEWPELENPRWGVIPASDLLEGRAQPVRNVATITYARVFPDTQELQKLEFDTGFGPCNKSQKYSNWGWDGCTSRCSRWQDGQWKQVWESEIIPGLFWPTPVVGDFDGDGNPEVATLPWHELLVLDARTGRVKDRIRNTTDRNARNYGRLGAHDLNGDGRPELVLYADFPKHVNVMGYRDGKLSVLWRRELEPDICYQQKLLSVVPNSVVDVEGDGKLEVLIGSLNDSGDWRWRLTVHDGMTGKVKAELADEQLQGVADVNGDGIVELLTMHAPGAVPPPFGTIRVWSLKGGKSSVLWEQGTAAWERWRHEEPLNVNDVGDGAGADRRDVLYRATERGMAVAYRQPGPNPEEAVVSVASWQEGGLQAGCRVTGPELRGLALDARGNLLVRARTMPGRRAAVSAAGGRVKSLGTYSKNIVPGAVSVVKERGAQRPVVICRSSEDRWAAFQPPRGSEPVRELWRRQGWGQCQWGGSLGFVTADLRCDGRRQVLYMETAPSGCARLTALGLDGREVWHRDFPRIGGTRIREGTDGMSDMAIWQVGHFTSLEHQDVVVTVRRSIHGTEESCLLSGLDGRELWRRDKQPTNPHLRGVGGLPFAIADFDGDGLDDLHQGYAFLFSVLKGSTGANITMVNGMGPQADGSPERSLLAGVAVACDPLKPGENLLFHGRGLIRPDGKTIWEDSKGLNHGGYPVCGDFDGDGKLEAMFSDSEGGLRCIATATGTLKWRMNPSIRPSAGVSADIDSDGRDEALLLSGRKLHCIGADPYGNGGVIQWTLELPADVGPPSIADVEGNGQASIVLVGGDGNVYCVK